MAGCTSRCRQGVLKLIQSLQRLVSGTLTKGTLSLKCTFHDGFMGSFPLRFIFQSTSKPITVDLLTYLKHLHNFFYKESICIPLLMLDAHVFFYHVVLDSINFPLKSSLFISSHDSCQCGLEQNSVSLPCKFFLSRFCLLYKTCPRNEGKSVIVWFH